MPDPHPSFFDKKTGDPVVDRVCDMYARRAQHGFKKYGTTLAGNPAGIMEWLQHAQEEAADLVVYLERAKEELNNIADVKKYLNDMADGKCKAIPETLRFLADSLGPVTIQTVKVGKE